jgi:hypothetical protein
MTKALKPCGTTSAYRRHLHRGEQPCDACREANKLKSQQEYASRSPEKHALYMQTNIKSRRKWHLRRMYGITLEEEGRLFQAQGSCCACCKSSTPKSEQGWCIDHEHDSKLIRGILCHPCNLGIGGLGDTLEGVQKAVNYLTAFAARKKELLAKARRAPRARSVTRRKERSPGLKQRRT